ncbi:MAG: hypothetical protein IJ088_00375 [Clostridia bacterium]|nr:hypothetical protein [Clostridia bacterium]
MSVSETVIEKKEHQAIVFRMNRKQAAAVARYIKEHSGSPEVAFAVDVDTMEMILQAKTASEEDFLLFEGEADVFDIEESEIEEEIEVDGEVDDEDREPEA